MSSKKAALIKNTIVIALGKMSTQFISLLLLPLYTAHLAAGEYGTVDLVVVIVALVAPIIMLSLEMAVFRFLIDGRGSKTQQSTIITNSLQMVLVSTILIALVYSIVMQFIAIPYGWLALAAVVASISSNYCLQVARGFGDNVKYALGSLVAGVTTVVLNILCIVIFQMGATGMLLATVVGNALCALYLAYVLRLYRYIDWSLTSKSKKRELLSYSLPLIPNNVSWWVVNAADRMIITAFLGVAANGIYAVAYKFPQMFVALYSFFALSWTESAAMHIRSKDRDAFFSQVANMSLRVFGSLGVILIAGAPLFFSIMVDETYHDAKRYVPLLLIGSLFSAIVGTYSAIYVAKKETKQVLYTSLSAAVISVGLSVLLIPLIGLYSPAVALIAAHITVAIFRHRDIKKSINITYDYTTIGGVTLLYTVAIILYYLDSVYAVVANIIVTGVGVIIINRHTLRTLQQTLFRKMKGLKQKQADKLAQAWEADRGAE